jgi:hypothetical protein
MVVISVFHLWLALLAVSWIFCKIMLWPNAWPTDCLIFDAADNFWTWVVVRILSESCGSCNPESRLVRPCCSLPLSQSRLLRLLSLPCVPNTTLWIWSAKTPNRYICMSNKKSLLRRKKNKPLRWLASRPRKRQRNPTRFVLLPEHDWLVS